MFMLLKNMILISNLYLCDDHNLSIIDMIAYGKET